MGLLSGITAGLGILNPVGLLGTGLAAGSGIADWFGTQQTNAQNAANVNNTNAANTANAQAANAMQMDLAEHGLAMKVADGASVNLSPLASIGASDPSINPAIPVLNTPSYTSPLNGLGADLNSVSQNISRAVSAQESPTQKASNALDLAYKAKENDLLDTQIALARKNLANPVGGPPGIPNAWTTMRNRDGSLSVVPSEGAGSRMFGPVLWSLENGLIPALQHGSRTILDAPLAPPTSVSNDTGDYN